jgi:hypothetical protein
LTALSAASLPGPGPLTYISTSVTPLSLAFLIAVSSALEAANGVDFLVPLKPDAPEEHHLQLL